MHRLILETRDAQWPDEAACAAHAAALASRPALRDACIELDGPLGAGKTTFVRHLLRALGVTGRVKSPSYAVVEPYQLASGPAWHFDFYRFGDPREWDDAGLRELFAGPGLKLVEWAANAGPDRPQPDLQLSLTPDATVPDRRHVRCAACTPRGRSLFP